MSARQAMRVALVVLGVVASAGGSAVTAGPTLDVSLLRVAVPEPSAVCWASDDGDDEDGDAPGTAVVMRAILQCGPEIGLSETQTRRLQVLMDAFMRETVERQMQLTIMEAELLTLLRPSVSDPLGPVDSDRAERTIRRLARLRAEQDLALVRTIEQLKSVLTGEQRRALTMLLRTPPPQRSDA